MRKHSEGKPLVKSEKAPDVSRAVGTAAIEAARALAESGSYTSYEALRSDVVTSFALEFAAAYGMDVPSSHGHVFLPVASLIRHITAVRSLPCAELTPEHFGHVHENLAGWKLEGRALVPSSERRGGGVHFTPRSLTEPIVRKTLAPAVAHHRETHPHGSVLSLHACDPSCGAGAFLVEMIRYLASEVMSEGRVPDLLVAKRLVAIHCTYGTDISAHAIESAKLAVWLECRADKMPSDWLDENLKVGDALVGLDASQVTRAHWSTTGLDKKGNPIVEVPEIETVMTSALTAYCDARLERKRQLSELAR